MADPILAFTDCNDNAELIEHCFTLGYLAEDRFTLDPTYGLGRFWKIRRPDRLVASDLDPERSPYGKSVDFLALPWPDETFEVVVFDPPYKLNGTSTGEGPSEADDDYGVTEYMGWRERHAMIKAGITESVRVLERGGVLLVKCQDQVCGGRIRFQAREFAEHTESIEINDQPVGMFQVDMLHLPGYRHQPKNRRQATAHRNYSTLLVFRKPKRAPKKKVTT